MRRLSFERPNVSPGPGAHADLQRLSSAERRELFFRVFPSIMLPMYLAIGDQTVLASALPAIVASFGEAERISWIMAAYLVANTIAAPVYGYLGDVLGRRRLMFVALGIYICAGIFCAFAPNVWFLIGGRLVQGLGGGGLMSLSQALVGEAVPARERGNFQGYLAGIGVSSTAIGPIMGGYVTEHLGWRFVFLFNVPIALLAVFLTMRLVARPGKRKADWRFDFQGLLLFVVFVLPVMFGLEQAQRLSASKLPLIFSLFLLAGFAFFVLLRHERKVASPLLPITLIKRRAIWMSNLMVMFQGAMLSSLVTFLPIYVRVLRGAPPSSMGWLLLPMMFGISIGSIISGRLVSHTGRTMIIPSLALIPSTALLTVYALVMPNLSMNQMSWLLGLTALMLGSVMSVVQVTVQLVSGPQNMGAGAASVQFARSVGAAFGTALFAAVLFATLSLMDPDAASYFAALLDSGPDGAGIADPARRAELDGVISTAFKAGFLGCAAFNGLNMRLAWIHPHRKLA